MQEHTENNLAAAENILSKNVLSEHMGALSEKVYDLEQKLEEGQAHKQDKINALEKTVTHNAKMLDALSLAHNRPQGDITDRSYTCKAFAHYVKTGDIDTKAFQSSNDEEGGFLVPQEISRDILTHLKEQSFFRSLAKTTTIGTEAFETLVAKDGMSVGWAKETADRPETSGTTFRRLRIRTHELYARPKATQKLIDDAFINIEQWIVQQVADEMAQKETEAFITGDGDGKPRGFLTYATEEHSGTPKIDSLKTGQNGAFSGENPAFALFDLVGAMLPCYLAGAVWLMSRSVAGAIQKLKEPNQMHYLWQAPHGASKHATLLGYPVYITEYMPALESGTQSYGLAFGNFKHAYHVVDRQDVHLLRDPYTAKPYVEFYTTKRVGGDVVNSDAIKVLHFSA